jgi:rod shape determining protein RodA
MKRAPFTFDYLLLAPVAVLVIFSLTTLLSINQLFFRSQLISLGVSVVAFIIFSQINLETLKQIKKPIYFVSIILLCIVLLIGIETRGASRWITLFGASLQFSEILKPFLAIAFATYLSEHQSPTRKTFFTTLALALPILLLINFQPDLGSALIYAGVVAFTLLVVGYPLLWFGLALLPILIAVPTIWPFLHEYQRQRILTFVHPASDPLGTSYNAIQAIIAVGSGSFFGKGLSEGTQSGLRFLPERQTDFIFATIAEGLGFVGTFIIILAFLFLCYRMYVIFDRSRDMFSKIFALGAFSFILIQCFVNIGMNMGYLPIVGVTLPFVSFGGSSLLSNFIFLGILSSISVSQRHKDVLEIR